MTESHSYGADHRALNDVPAGWSPQKEDATEASWPLHVSSGGGYTYTTLRYVRGWSDREIREWLGKPDELRAFPSSLLGEPMRIYSEERVIAAERLHNKVRSEQRDNFQRKMARNASRNALMAESVRVEFSVPRLREDALLVSALVAYQRRHGRNVEAHAPKLFLFRLCVNYLLYKTRETARLKLSNGNGEDLTLTGQSVLNRFSRPSVKNHLTRRMMLEMAELYPRLRTTCEQVYSSRTRGMPLFRMESGKTGEPLAGRWTIQDFD